MPTLALQDDVPPSMLVMAKDDPVDGNPSSIGWFIGGYGYGRCRNKWPENQWVSLRL